MKWKCDACNTKVKGEVCQGCGAVLPDPATTRSTENMRRALRSAPFVLAVIFFTLALLLSVTLSALSYQAASWADVQRGYHEFEQAVGITLPQNLYTATEQAMSVTTPDIGDIISNHLLSALACLGFWLLVATGFRRGRIGRSGAVILKVITIMELVAVCLGMVAMAGLAVFLVYGRDWLLNEIANLGEWDGLVQALREVTSNSLYATVVWVTAGVMIAAMVIALFFLIGAIKTENEVIRVSKFGRGRKVSVFMSVLLIIGAVNCLASGVYTLVGLNWWGGCVVLSGLYMLLLAITVLRYRGWSKERLWSDENPEGMEQAMAAIPTDLNTAELLADLDEDETPEPEIEPETTAEPAEPEAATEPEPEEAPAEEEAPKPITGDPVVDSLLASIRSTQSNAPKEEAPASTVCPHCGAVMKGKAFFCEECGQVL